jgi:DNA invertase Pin-like site-specific DNA recombinase
VAFHSFTEQHLSTENELVRDILLAVMASLAKVERTKAGLERAKAKGSKLGRPALGYEARTRIAALARGNPGMSAYAIAKAVGCAIKTAQKYVRQVQALAG